jgi:hypothetical protein
MELIKQALEPPYSMRGIVPDPPAIHQQAFCRAKEIEASCWSSARCFQNDAYCQIMMAKTRQVCTALLMKFPGPAAAGRRPQMPPAPPEKPATEDDNCFQFAKAEAKGDTDQTADGLHTNAFDVEPSGWHYFE